MNQQGITPQLENLIALRREIARLNLFAKQKVTTEQVDDQASMLQGRGMDFAEVRAYQPGDDVRNIDWRVTARRGSVHTKVFQEERERPVLFYLNLSDSMRFGTRVAFKSVIAARLCSLLAWAAADHGDRVGGIVVAGQQHKEIRPRRKQHGVLSLLRSSVEAAQWPGEIAAQDCRQHLLRLHQIAKPGSLLILLSDYYAWDDECWQLLRSIRNRAQVHILHVFDVFEATPPKPNQYWLTDGVKKLLLNTRHKKTREQYSDVFAKRQKMIEDYCLSSAIPYLAVRTDADLAAVLAKEVAKWNLY